MVLTGVYHQLNGPNVAALRTIRLLRPLRSINKIQGFKLLVQSLIESVNYICNVALFLFFIIVLYAIFGLHLLSGMYEYRCRLTEEPVDGKWELLPDYYQLCNPYWGNCPIGSFCGAPREKGIPWDEEEINNPAFNFGITGFDNIQKSIFMILQLFFFRRLDRYAISYKELYFRDSDYCLLYFNDVVSEFLRIQFVCACTGR